MLKVEQNFFQTQHLRFGRSEGLGVVGRQRLAGLLGAAPIRKAAARADKEKDQDYSGKSQEYTDITLSFHVKISLA